MEKELEKYIPLLEQKVFEMFHKESSGHDLYHLQRVYNLALHIQETEGGDRLVVGIAAFLHDVHRIIEKETGKFCPPKESLPTILKLLTEVDFPKEKISNVLHCVEFHDEYNFTNTGNVVSDIETLIIQDADNIDAMGAIGIGRTFTFGGAYGLPMWIPEVPFQKNFEGEHKIDPSTIHHVYSKLLELKGNMNTSTGKHMAETRHEFTQAFFDHFIKEWNGKL